MAYQAVPGTAAFTIVVSHFGQLCANTFYVKISGLNWNNGYIDQINMVIRTWWYENIRGMVTAATTLQKVVGMRLDTDPAEQRVLFPEGFDGEGTDDSEGTISLPGNVTVAITWRTANVGKSYRGRTYHIGLLSRQILGNQLAGGTMAGLLAAYTELTAAIHADAFFTQGVVSRYSNGVKRETGVFTPITQVTMDSALDSQRRRLAGRGQ